MNRLFEKMKVPCHMMDKVSSEGPFGVQHEWKVGAPFKAAVVKDRSLQARVAEHDGVKAVYTVTAEVGGVDFDFHDVIKRDSDGATFRVTTMSEDSRPPKVATFDFVQVNAERWDIPRT